MHHYACDECGWVGPDEPNTGDDPFVIDCRQCGDTAWYVSHDEHDPELEQEVEAFVNQYLLRAHLKAVAKEHFFPTTEGHN
jgi:hypothetical protein